MRFIVCAVLAIVLSGNFVRAALAQSKNEQSPEQVEGEGSKPKSKLKRAVIKYKPQPAYTEEARRNSIEGVVVLRVVLSKDGRVSGVQVKDGLPYGLTESAVEAAKRIKFEPARRDGRPISVYVLAEYNFKL